MAIVSRPAMMPVRHGPGFSERVFADSSVFGTPIPMVGRCIELEAHAELLVDGLGAGAGAGAGEAMLYVAAGSGSAVVGTQARGLETETALWLDPGQTLLLKAGDRGLEVLVAQAPG